MVSVGATSTTPERNIAPNTGPAGHGLGVNPHIPSNPRTRPMYSGFPHVVSRIGHSGGSGVPSSESCNKAKAKAKAVIYMYWVLEYRTGLARCVS